MPASCQQALPLGPSDAEVAYPHLSCLACHAFLRIVLGLFVCLCFCDRVVALPLLLFFFCPSCHLRPSIDSWPASSHTLPPIKSRSTSPLQRSGLTLLRLPGASAPDLRESRGSSAPAVATAGSAIKKLTGPDASFPCALCGRTSNRHSQRTVFSALWLCVLETCNDVNYSCSQHFLHGENALASSRFSVSVLIKNA